MEEFVKENLLEHKERNEIKNQLNTSLIHELPEHSR